MRDLEDTTEVTSEANPGELEKIDRKTGAIVSLGDEGVSVTLLAMHKGASDCCGSESSQPSAQNAKIEGEVGFPHTEI